MQKVVCFPQILEATRGKKVIDIGCGAYHSLIVAEEEGENGKIEVVFTFGSNLFGQLGNGTFVHSAELQRVFAPSMYANLFPLQNFHFLNLI